MTNSSPALKRISVVALTALAAVTLSACGSTSHKAAQPTGVAVAKGTPPASLAQAAARSKNYSYCENLAATTNPTQLSKVPSGKSAEALVLWSASTLASAYQEQALFSAAAAAQAPNASLQNLLTDMSSGYASAAKDLQPYISELTTNPTLTKQQLDALLPLYNQETAAAMSAVNPGVLNAAKIFASCPALAKYITTSK
jgi:hypothetical protein